MIRRAGDALAAIERALTIVAVAFLFVIMVLVVADVFMRYVLNRPLSFAYDLIGLYLLAGVLRRTPMPRWGSQPRDRSSRSRLRIAPPSG